MLHYIGDLQEFPTVMDNLVHYKQKSTITHINYSNCQLYCHFSFLQVWINQGDIILIGLRDYQDAKADVILKYTPDEARNLKTYGEFPETGTTFKAIKSYFKLIFRHTFMAL